MGFFFFFLPATFKILSFSWFLAIWPWSACMIFFFSSLEFSEFLESVICCLALILENSQQLPVSLFCCCYCCYSLLLLGLQLPLLSNSCLILSNSFCCSARPLSHIWLFETPWTVACQAPLSLEFSRQEYWLEWVAIPFSRGSSWPRDRRISCIADGFFTVWATKDACPPRPL